MNRFRSSLLSVAVVALGLVVAACSRPAAAAGPEITVYKSPTCGCCAKWVDHLREHDFQVTAVDTDGVAAVKRQHGVPDGLASCHTALVAGYVVEGHVPADVIRKLLAERPPVKGIAVPGMPMGSPGMEGPYEEKYEVFTFDESGPKDVFAVR